MILCNAYIGIDKGYNFLHVRPVFLHCNNQKSSEGKTEYKNNSIEVLNPAQFSVNELYKPNGRFCFLIIRQSKSRK